MCVGVMRSEGACVRAVHRGADGKRCTAHHMVHVILLLLELGRLDIKMYEVIAGKHVTYCNIKKTIFQMKILTYIEKCSISLRTVPEQQTVSKKC